jgi:hypothetical protein
MDPGNAPDALMPSTPVPATELPQADSPTPPVARDASDRLVLLSQAYLLEQLVSHGGTGETAAALNRGITKTAQRELGLTAKVANDLRARLAERGYLAGTKEGRTVRYAITESGRAYLASLERPSLSGRAKSTTAMGAKRATGRPSSRSGRSTWSHSPSTGPEKILRSLKRRWPVVDLGLASDFDRFIPPGIVGIIVPAPVCR